MKWLERIAITAVLLITLMLPTLPMGWKSMSPGYFLVAAAVAGFFESIGMACIAIGFLATALSTVLAFLDKWGATACFAFVGACIFGVTVLLQLFHYKNPVGIGLWALLTVLAVHSLFSVKWYLQGRKDH
jgi:hypothetical protein